MSFIISLVFGLGLRIWLAMRKSTARLLGRAESERDALKEVLDNVEKSKKARERLRDNPDLRKRLRDKYTRRS